MYKVNFYKGNYRWRQQQANSDGCDAYVEQHFNSSGNRDPNYVVVITGYYASKTSKKWGKLYASYIREEFDIPLGGKNGLMVGGYNGRGVGSLKHTKMPAILLEPMFVSNKQGAEVVKSEDGQLRLAQVLAKTIISTFPDGSTIGFSVGHKYKSAHSKDRGASVYGGGSEADYAEIVMNKAKAILEGHGEKVKKTINGINING